MGGEAGHGISKKLYVYTVSGNLGNLSTGNFLRACNSGIAGKHRYLFQEFIGMVVIMSPRTGIFSISSRKQSSIEQIPRPLNQNGRHFLAISFRYNFFEIAEQFGEFFCGVAFFQFQREKK